MSSLVAIPIAPNSLPLPTGLVRGIAERSPRARLRLAIPALDALFGGGLPCGVVTEVFGRHASGRTALAHVLVAAALAAGECVAWVDLPNALDPDWAEQVDGVCARVLWVRPADTLMAFRAAEQVIAAGGFRLVILDVDDPTRWRSPIPTSTWLRLTHAALRHDAAVVVLSTAHVSGTFAALSLEASLRPPSFVGAGGSACLFAGMTSAFHLLHHKLGPPGSTPVDLFLSTTA